jgi:hypothetical protein
MHFVLRRTALAWNEAATSPAGQAFLDLANRRFDAGEPASRAAEQRGRDLGLAYDHPLDRGTDVAH